MAKKVVVTYWEDDQGERHDTEESAVMADRIESIGVGVRVAVEKYLPDALRRSGNGKAAINGITTILMASYHIVPRNEIKSIGLTCRACEGSGDVDGFECCACRGTGLAFAPAFAPKTLADHIHKGSQQEGSCEVDKNTKAATRKKDSPNHDVWEAACKEAGVPWNARLVVSGTVAGGLIRFMCVPDCWTADHFLDVDKLDRDGAELEVDTPFSCSHCDGTGFEHGTHSRARCENCEGKGGFVKVQCKTCRGSGRYDGACCKTCKGSGGRLIPHRS